MNKIPYEERQKVYSNALIHFGETKQLRYFLGINDRVCEMMDRKVMRLDGKLKKEAGLAFK